MIKSKASSMKKKKPSTKKAAPIAKKKMIAKKKTETNEPTQEYADIEIFEDNTEPDLITMGNALLAMGQLILEMGNSILEKNYLDSSKDSEIGILNLTDETKNESMNGLGFFD